MEYKNFITQLSQVHEAVSVQGKHYTDIHISGTHIEYTRESNSRESIDIQELFKVYEKAYCINTSILRNYITGSKLSPALAILLAAGFYNEQGERLSEKELLNIESETLRGIFLRFKKGKLKGGRLKVFKELVKENALKIFRNRYVARSFLIFPVLIILSAIILYYPGPKDSTALIFILILLVIINTAFFLYLVIFKTDSFQEKTYTAYFTLMIFNIGIFPLFNYIKDYHERNKVEVEYTAGFRAWGSTVRFSNIKISYYDKFGNPFSLDSSEIFKKSNWKTKLWTDDNNIGGSKLKDSVAFNLKPGEFSITLTNCGAVLDSKVFKEHKAFSFYVDASVELLGIDTYYLKNPTPPKYYSAQFCLKVPHEVRNSIYNKIYYGFEFFFSDFTLSKLRIPGLNFDYTMSELYYQNKYDSNSYTRNVTDTIAIKFLKFKDGKKIQRIEKDTIIHLSAVYFNDDAAFYIMDNNSSLSLPLFNINTKKYGVSNLMRK